MAYARAPYRRTFRRKSEKKSTTYRKKTTGGLVRKTYKPKPKAVRFALTKPMRHLVDARVDKNLEVKTVKAALWNPTDANFIYTTMRPAITALSVATLIPRLKQASVVSDIANASVPVRLGNVIHPKYCKLRLRIWVDQNDTTYGIGAGDRCTLQPYIFIGTCKSAKSYSQLIANNWAILRELWRNFTPYATTNAPTAEFGDAVPFDGVRSHFTQGCLNTSKFQPIKGGIKTFELIRPLGYAVGDPTTGSAGFTIPYCGKTMEWNIPMPQKLVYSDDIEDYPAAYNPICCIGFTYMNGAAPNEQAPLRVESSLQFDYTDA